jgi:hypothetical protein
VNKENLQSINARSDLYGNLVGGLADESRAHDDLMVYKWEGFEFFRSTISKTRFTYGF